MNWSGLGLRSEVAGGQMSSDQQNWREEGRITSFQMMCPIQAELGSWPGVEGDGSGNGTQPLWGGVPRVKNQALSPADHARDARSEE